MTERISLDDLVHQGLNALLNPMALRKQGAAKLPDLALDRVATGMDAAERRHLSEVFIREVWDKIAEERGDMWGRGWDELTASAALTLELLSGEALPHRIRRALRNTSAEMLWTERRIAYQRFVLLVTHECEIRRIVKRETGEIVIDAPHFQGKSHTLMRTLLERDLLDDLGVPVAATGEYTAEGQVSHVSELEKKAITWWTHYPDGLLISCVPTHEERCAVTMACTPSNRSPRYGSSEPPMRMGAWIVGETIEEITYKLARHQDSHDIMMWPDTRRPAHQLPDARFLQEGSSKSFEEVLLQQRKHYKETHQASGVLILGGPGSGKSIFSQLLENIHMVGGVSGQCGVGMRVTARKLAKYLEETSAQKPDWSDFFKKNLPDEEDVIEALGRTCRLVPIIDGLDEVSTQELERIMSWLSGGRGVWVASSRPIGQLDALSSPSVQRLELAELAMEDVRELLDMMGRVDLFDRLFPEGKIAQDVIGALGRTPLHLTMMAQVYGGADRLPSAYEVYSRVFTEWLNQDVRAGRLGEHARELLRSSLDEFIGEVALRWLQSEKTDVSRALIDDVFRLEKITVERRGELLQALASVNLLLPIGANYEFAHRTFAEYAAACALRRRVRGRDVEGELEELKFMLQDGLLQKSKWKTLLAFYAHDFAHPHAIFERLIILPTCAAHPVEFSYSRQNDFCEHWTFVLSLMSRCNQWSEAQARATWTTALRLMWFIMHHELSYVNLTAWHELGESLAEHLPETLEAHVLLLEEQTQRERLEEMGLEILDAMPHTLHGDMMNRVMRTDASQEETVKILKWFLQLGRPPAARELDALLDRWSEDDQVRPLLWELCLMGTPQLLDERILKMIQQHKVYSFEHLERWMQVEPSPERADAHHKIRRNVLTLLLGHKMWHAQCRRRRLQRLSRRALDAIPGVLWECTPPGERGPLGAALLGRDTLPSQLSVADAITIYLEERYRTESYLEALAPWFEARLEQLEEYCVRAVGERRFIAVRVLSRVTEEPEIEALARHLEGADEDYVSRAHERISTLADGTPHEPLPANVDMARMSLMRRIRQRFGAWKLELYEELGKPRISDSLLDLVRELRIRDMLRVLIERLDQRNHPFDEHLLPCIAALLPEDEPQLTHRVMRHTLTLVWPYKSAMNRMRTSSADPVTPEVQHLMRSLCVEDLELLLEQEHAVQQDSLLAGAIRALGSEGREWMLTRYRALRQEFVCDDEERVAALEALREEEQRRTQDFEQESSTMFKKLFNGRERRRRQAEFEQESRKQLKTLNTLAKTIITCLDVEEVPFLEFTCVVNELVLGDRHLIYSIPGSLGKDFDEPHDRNFYSEQQNRELIKAIDEKINQYRDLRDEVELLEGLRTMLRHPSETLRLSAFSQATREVESHQIAALANDAIEGHFQCNDTQWEGELTQLRLSGGVAGGAGSSSVFVPHTVEKLVSTLENHLTTSHWRDVVAPLLKSDETTKKLLGVRLARIVGSTSHFATLAELLSDVDAHVTSAALDCLLDWDPSSARELVSAHHASWSPEQSSVMLNAFIIEENPVKNGFMKPGEVLKRAYDVSRYTKGLPPYRYRVQESELRRLPAALILEWFEGAARRLEAEPHAERSIFKGFPSAVDRFIELHQEEFRARRALLQGWLHHPHQPVRAVALRWLAVMRGEVPSELLSEFIHAPTNADRFSAVEAIILTGNETHHQWALQVLRAVSSYTRYDDCQDEDNESILPEPVPYLGREMMDDRVLWALQYAPPTFVDVLPTLAARLPDDLDGFLSAEGEEICRRIALLVDCWGEESVLLLLDLLDRGEVDRSIASYITYPSLSDTTREKLELRANAEEPQEFSRDLWQRISSIFASPHALREALNDVVSERC